VRADSSSNASADVLRATTLLRGSAALSGLVHGADGKPLQGATIIVWGTGLETKSRSDGHFAITGLPAGTFSVEARMLGYEPRRVAVDLSPQTPATVNLEFKDRVQELSRVVVMGKPSHRSSDIEGFLQRSRNGMGHYITASDNALKNAIEATDALRMTPGVQVVPGSGFGHVILMRGGCVPVVYVDGMQMQDGYSTLDDIVPPRQVAGIETYVGLGEAPVQYQSNGCGVVLVWTKR
jgi:carboxypeptidase family protein/TonB-dependent receptor-like protein